MPANDVLRCAPMCSDRSQRWWLLTYTFQHKWREGKVREREKRTGEDERELKNTGRMQERIEGKIQVRELKTQETSYCSRRTWGALDEMQLVHSMYYIGTLLRPQTSRYLPYTSRPLSPFHPPPHRRFVISPHSIAVISIEWQDPADCSC